MNDLHEIAEALAVSLAVIPAAPYEPALRTLAGDLERMCADEREMGALVARARRWPKWGGLNGLCLELEDLRGSAPERQVYRRAAAPTPRCATCGDWGHRAGAAGKREWCDCPAGAELRAEARPGFLEALSPKGGKRPWIPKEMDSQPRKSASSASSSSLSEAESNDSKTRDAAS